MREAETAGDESHTSRQASEEQSDAGTATIVTATDGAATDASKDGESVTEATSNMASTETETQNRDTGAVAGTGTGTSVSTATGTAPSTKLSSSYISGSIYSSLSVYSLSGVATAAVGVLYATESDDNKPNCPGQHGLQKFATPSNTWYCSNCTNRVAQGVFMHGCRTCDFDLCDSCLKSGVKAPPRVRSPPRPPPPPLPPTPPP